MPLLPCDDPLQSASISSSLENILRPPHDNSSRLSTFPLSSPVDDRRCRLPPPLPRIFPETGGMLYSSSWNATLLAWIRWVYMGSEINHNEDGDDPTSPREKMLRSVASHPCLDEVFCSGGDDETRFCRNVVTEMENFVKEWTSRRSVIDCESLGHPSTSPVQNDIFPSYGYSAIVTRIIGEISSSRARSLRAILRRIDTLQDLWSAGHRPPNSEDDGDNVLFHTVSTCASCLILPQNSFGRNESDDSILGFDLSHCACTVQYPIVFRLVNDVLRAYVTLFRGYLSTSADTIYQNGCLDILNLSIGRTKGLIPRTYLAGAELLIRARKNSEKKDELYALALSLLGVGDILCAVYLRAYLAHIAMEIWPPDIKDRDAAVKKNKRSTDESACTFIQFLVRQHLQHVKVTKMASLEDLSSRGNWRTQAPAAAMLLASLGTYVGENSNFPLEESEMWAYVKYLALCLEIPID
mmetsp:Transcript_20697/g.46958  ORF Transcript_20697/g.46958 Transcript_20697/m.46958 type:complete len:468 (-) Transcript_20697:15-1418(-)